MEKYCPECGTEYLDHQERCERDGRRLIPIVSDDLWVGRELDGRYHVKRVLGKGGMGTVFEVEQSLLGRRLALKLLRRELGQDKASVMRFFAEAKALASLRSPHTVTLHDFGSTEEGQLFFTMDLLEGVALSDLLVRERRLSYARACSLVLHVLDSLEEAHDRNILHRDLKPENVFVTQVKGREFAIVLDFGIAKLIGDPCHEGVTSTGLICGTPAYMSPEQALGNPAVKSSDLYSLGVMLYEMLSGQLPFQGSTALRLAMSHISELPAPITQRAVGVDIPKPLEGFLEQALEKEAACRFPDAASFRSALLQAMFQCADGETQTQRAADVEEVLQASSSEWNPGSWADLQRLALPRPSGRRRGTTRWKAMALLSAAGLVLTLATALAGRMLGGDVVSNPAPGPAAAVATEPGVPAPSPNAQVLSSQGEVPGKGVLAGGTGVSDVASRDARDVRLESPRTPTPEPVAASGGASGGRRVALPMVTPLDARKGNSGSGMGTVRGLLSAEAGALLEVGRQAWKSPVNSAPVLLVEAPSVAGAHASRRTNNRVRVGTSSASVQGGAGGIAAVLSANKEDIGAAEGKGMASNVGTEGTPGARSPGCKGAACPAGGAGGDDLDFRPVKPKVDPAKLGVSPGEGG